MEEHLVEGELEPGSPIGLRVDQTLLQDATGTMACMQFEQLDVSRVRVDRAVQYVDHNVIELGGRTERAWVQAKDEIVALLRQRRVSGGKNKGFELTGPGTANLPIPERGTIANMIAELGATSAVFPPDEKTRDWLHRQQRDDDFVDTGPDDGAEYDDRIEIDLDELGP